MYKRLTSKILLPDELHAGRERARFRRELEEENQRKKEKAEKKKRKKAAAAAAAASVRLLDIACVASIIKQSSLHHP